MVEARTESFKTINHTQLLQLTIAIAAVSSSWFSLAGTDHEYNHPAHPRHFHNHWRLI